MNRNAVLSVVVAAAVAALAFPIAALADDYAALIVNGRIVPRREARIVIAKEVIWVNGTKVVVDYDFRNDSDEKVTTEVVFPVPPFDMLNYPFMDASPIFNYRVTDFRTYVDGKPVPFETDTRATLEKQDVTNVLAADKIDIASFAHFTPSLYWPLQYRDFSRLSKTRQKRLVALHLFDSDRDSLSANWTVHIQYHWTQIFPAHSIVHIRHEYSPTQTTALTYTFFDVLPPLLDPSNTVTLKPTTLHYLRDSVGPTCLEPELLQYIHDESKYSNRLAYHYSYHSYWVGFLLTAANSWKEPIEDFTLILERLRPIDGMQFYVGTCLPAEVEKVDDDHFKIHITDFVPDGELHLSFWSTTLPTPVVPTAKK